jgi:protein-tyrosine phosphatase
VGAWRVESAGTWGLDGSDMADSVKVVLKERGITPETHAARTVNAEMLNAFDLILTMEKGQQEALRIEFPEVAERVYLLSEMIGERFNINDPIGQSLTEFRNTARNIATILDEGFEKIKQLTGGRNDL